MSSPRPHEAETLLPPSALADPATTRSSVADSLGVPASGYDGVRESQYSSVPLNQSFDPYADAGTPSPRGTTPSHYRDDNQKSEEVGAAGAYAHQPYGSEPPAKTGKRKWFWILAALVALAIVVVAVIVPVYYTVIKPKNNTAVSSSGGGHSSSAPAPTQSGDPGTVPQEAITGGDGSTIKTETGSFIYNNTFGGFWYYDPKSPFSNNAQAQSWSPPLNQSWKFGTDKIRGVNLGGWLVLEPFITPALYEPYQNASIPAIDEWTLCTNLAADKSSGGVAKVLEDHYNTFITEEDFAQIAAAGLNWVRIPFPYWAIEVYPGEPFLEKVAWKYFLKAIGWARKYGIRINLDLHTIPGSQNGYNHSGKLGSINWMHGTMGIANAQRSLNYMRIIAEFVSQPQYRDVVCMFGIVNEAVIATIGQDVIQSFYLEAYEMIRNITGYGEGNGPWLSVHDGFAALSSWADFLPNSDRVAMDTHPYFSFGSVDTDPITSQTTKPCTAWGANVNTSMTNYGMTAAGEFSNGFNDCGLFLNGVNRGARYDGTFDSYSGTSAGAGACVQWMDVARWNQATKDAIKQFALSSMDATQNYFFWTWKIGKSTTWGTVASPLWSYKLGLDNGFMPTDPRQAVGVCSNASPWNGPLPASKTGGGGAGPIDAAYRTQYAWPPASLSGGVNPAALPTYTATQTVISLTPATYTISGTQTADAGTGWVNTADTNGMYTTIAGCAYPTNAWDAVDATQGACTVAAQRVFKGRWAMPRETGNP
ncbi:putative glucan 1,3-beta-glucosidase D [Rhizoctonia solani AG-1 IB]|uniref:glucan 1,3-beta-glucosidase n=1 Tax=Thanatephorus cucumeris (strain AG1-IB / isolate 7/3/14) TaxID=1108050 RepID=M5BZR8_THACB|nr:putative glucan 1,3-beta-glucosidase D [Rhizoctonia solani AG-1 IB]